MLWGMDLKQLEKLGPVLHALMLKACEHVGVSPAELQVSCITVLDDGNTIWFQLTPPEPEDARDFVVEEL